MQIDGRKLRSGFITLVVATIAVVTIGGIFFAMVVGEKQFREDCEKAGGSVVTEYETVQVPYYDSKGNFKYFLPQQQGRSVCKVP